MPTSCGGCCAAQHPDLADRRLQRIGTGWDNEVYRLGLDLTVRVPRRELGARLMAARAAVGARTRSRPDPAGARPGSRGRATDFYPWPWAVLAHIPGRPPGASAFTGPAGVRAAQALAGFLSSLHVPAPADAPRSPFRGVPLAQRSDSVARALASAPAAQRSRIERVLG